MGLDLYLYEINKPDLKQAKSYTSDELQDKEICWSPITVKNPEAIKENSVIISLKEYFFNPEKVGKACGVHNAKNMHINGHKANMDLESSEIIMNIELFDASNKSIYKGDFIFDNNKKENVCDVKVYAVYAFKTDEIAYQRKGIDDYGELPENCEYCDDFNVVKRLTYCGLDEEFVNLWKEGKTLFFPWW